MIIKISEGVIQVMETPQEGTLRNLKFFEKLGIKLTTEFGPKYKKEIRYLLRANKCGKFQGYRFVEVGANHDRAIEIYGERAGITISWNDKVNALEPWSVWTIHKEI